MDEIHMRKGEILWITDGEDRWGLAEAIWTVPSERKWLKFRLTESSLSHHGEIQALKRLESRRAQMVERLGTIVECKLHGVPTAMSESYEVELTLITKGHGSIYPKMRLRGLYNVRTRTGKLVVDKAPAYEDLERSAGSRERLPPAP